MNLKDLFKEDKALQTKKIFTAAEGIIAIQIKAGSELKEHVTKVPAFLICVSGEVIFENENGISEKLYTGNFVNIEANVKHLVKADADSTLLLVK